LLNLLSNAVKFTERGEIELTVGLHRPIGLRATSSRSILRCAIPASASRRSHRSTLPIVQPGRCFNVAQIWRHGIGLIISKRLSEIMGGTLWLRVKSASARLSTLRSWLNPHPPEAARSLGGRASAIERQTPADRRRQRHQSAHFAVASQGVGHAGTRYFFAADRVEWIRRGDPFDLVITDLQMPGMDGIALAKAIRQWRDATALRWCCIRRWAGARPA